jgi:hypothetical protein
MNQPTNFEDAIRKHKRSAIAMGVILAIIIVLHFWHEGIENVLPTLQQSLK